MLSVLRFTGAAHRLNIHSVGWYAASDSDSELLECTRHISLVDYLLPEPACKAVPFCRHIPLHGELRALLIDFRLSLKNDFGHRTKWIWKLIEEIHKTLETLNTLTSMLYLFAKMISGSKPVIYGYSMYFDSKVLSHNPCATMYRRNMTSQVPRIGFNWHLIVQVSSHPGWFYEIQCQVIIKWSSILWPWGHDFWSKSLVVA